MTENTFDWSELAFGSKKPLRALQAIFIAAPRELSVLRFKQLIKSYLPKGNIVLGLAKEDYIDGFQGQPQFRTLKGSTVHQVIDMVNSSNSAHKIYTLEYFQRDAQHVLDKGGFRQAIFVNGSWKYIFHVSPVYYTLVNNKIPYKLVSPFASEAEARAYEERLSKDLSAAFWPKDPVGLQTARSMLNLAGQVAQFSFDYGFQTGVTLGKKVGTDKYDFILAAFNKVVPFQTFAMHNGASRETNFSPPNDLNHYDAVHAEVEAIILAGKRGINLDGTTLFINLSPCPSCARMFVETGIAEFIYSVDHSDGYAVRLLENAGKKVTRIVV